MLAGDSVQVPAWGLSADDLVGCRGNGCLVDDTVPFFTGQTILGNTLFRMNRNEDAEIVYKKAVELNPQSMEALHNLAVLCHRAGRDKEAWSYYQKALENGAQPNPKLESEIPAKAKQAIETVTTKTE